MISTEDIKSIAARFRNRDFSDVSNDGDEGSAMLGALAIGAMGRGLMGIAIAAFPQAPPVIISKIAIEGTGAVVAVASYAFLSGNWDHWYSFTASSGGVVAFYTFAAIGDPRICPLRDG